MGQAAAAWRDVNVKSTIVDDRKSRGKKVRNFEICTKSAEVRQIVGSVPADRWILVEALRTSEKLNFRRKKEKKFVD